MILKSLSVAGLLLCVAAVSTSGVGSKAVSDKLAGDYVEVRTAAVFAGACHYNGEFVTTGREAVMAWSFTGGVIDGVDLTGVRAMAGVTASASLGDELASRKSEIVVDSSASDKQVEAVVALIKSKCAAQIGRVVEVRRAPIAFAHDSKGYTVNANGFANMTVQHMPDNTCCSSPGEVWYSPLSPIAGRKVGYTESASYTGNLTQPWQRFGENNAFYGPIAF